MFVRRVVAVSGVPGGVLDAYSGHLPELRVLMSGCLHDALGDSLADVEARREQSTAWLIAVTPA
jgi:hypothetical protein